MRKVLCVLVSMLPVLSGCGPAKDAACPPTPEVPVGEQAKTVHMEFLRTEGRQVVNDRGEAVQLRGCNAGAWLLIEPWIIGMDGQTGVNSEKDLWDLIGRRFGEDRKQELIRLHRETFFQEADVERIAVAGMNCLRIPIWWRAVSDPAYGGDMKYLGAVVEWCGRHGVYAIIDLHGAPGGQSTQAVIIGESSEGDLWKDEEFKKQTVAWWTDVAERFKDVPAVAGYDLINEAFSAPFNDLLDLYDEIYRAVRAIDSRHIIIVEDGLHGFHRLPRPADYGWSNVMYSFHYYPQSGAEALEADKTVIPRFNRAVLHYGVPVLVGEFNTIAYERGGVQSLQRYGEVFDYFGWPWTFWTYKKVEDNADIIWGLYGYYAIRPKADLNNGTWESIRGAFASMETSQSQVQSLMLCSLQGVKRPLRSETRKDAVELPLRDAAVIRGEGGSIQMEWGWMPPNVGYWGKDDAVGWYVDVPAEGDYELGLRMANNSNGCAVRVQLDGILMSNVPVAQTGGWQDYQDRSLGVYHMAQGRHWLEVGQGNAGDEFINMQHAWMRAGSGERVVPDEGRIVLGPFNGPRWHERSPIRVEWMNDPPNFGFWQSGEPVTWEIDLERGGSFDVAVEYGSPQESRLKVALDEDGDVLNGDLASTDGWHVFKRVGLGIATLTPGHHRIVVTWDGADAGGAGNLRSVTLARRGEPAGP
ncbi:MAG TPA: cellulase family glycosylhydrolase [Kiritimatiellia bacterium]|nr:cellulase family glycosylhydrolase [Kiritimatiellia bacterium]